jgi:hypothetical protein
MVMRKVAKWIQMSGKPNKDFLAKPQASRKRIGNNDIKIPEEAAATLTGISNLVPELKA